ncbi:MAG TPA: 2OG-Fe(II) oxygenase [Casimicrobiaceae bacterium]|nr:2OG-Fe(II) oxygenase [Casimicrobiaceae bacterium]
MVAVSDAAAFSMAIDPICAAIAEEGWAVTHGFLPAGAIVALARDARRRDEAGEFRDAGVGRGHMRTQRPDIRGDRIAWLDQGMVNAATRPWWDTLERLRIALNGALFLGLLSFEGHYAIYPPGASYRRHRDRFCSDDGRVLSCVLYLNESWSEADGGALRIYVDGAVARDILPVGGTLACFLSDDFEHEVLPATRERLALTGWFRRRA